MKDMKDKWEIVFSGVGGQGLILSGTILGETAVLHGKKNAVLTSAYGTETRGTFTKSDVIISKDTIYYPEVINEDVVLALAQVAYDRYAGNLREDAVLLYDSDLVSDVKESKARQIGIPFSRLAQEMGKAEMANIIALGAIIKLTKVVEPADVLKVLAKRFSHRPGILELNQTMFHKGMEMVVS